MLNGGTFNFFLRNGLWAEEANTSMLLENNFMTKSRDLSTFQHYFGKGKEVSALILLQKFEEICIMTYYDKIIVMESRSQVGNLQTVKKYKCST